MTREPRSGADVETIAAAFPRGALGEPVCLFDGAPRQRDHALCRRCWFGLSEFTRITYRGLGLVERARLLLELRPKATVSA